MTSKDSIDINENTLRKTGRLLDILLFDHTTTKRIIWATDSYGEYGKKFEPQKRITPSLITGKYSTIIQPRATKSFNEQRQRTKDKAEVFTPLKIVAQINKAVDKTRVNKNNWQEYIRELKLEITCGEAPFIASRYDPTSHTGKLIKLKNRVGFLDRKLKIVSKYCDNKKDWVFWAKEAFKASYGYEWQGDNILLARENLLYTFIDYYKDRFKRLPNFKLKEEIAKIISWNLFQMDGLKYVVPMSCHHEDEHQCEGCKYNRPDKHNGMYVKIMDWEKGKVIRFVELMDYWRPRTESNR